MNRLSNILQPAAVASWVETLLATGTCILWRAALLAGDRAPLVWALVADWAAQARGKACGTSVGVPPASRTRAISCARLPSFTIVACGADLAQDRPCPVVRPCSWGAGLARCLAGVLLECVDRACCQVCFGGLLLGHKRARRRWDACSQGIVIGSIAAIRAGLAGLQLPIVYLSPVAGLGWLLTLRNDSTGPWDGNPLGSSEKEQLNPDQQCEVSIPSLPRAEIFALDIAPPKAARPVIVAFHSSTVEVIGDASDHLNSA